MGESHLVEYKRELTKEVDIEKDAVAFLNSKTGGDLILGTKN